MVAHGETITDGRMVTRELAAWIGAGLQIGDVPDEVPIGQATRSFTDFLGETLFVSGT